MRIAVIGSGISGMAAAYYLSRKHDVFLFEEENRVGGHTHTVTVQGSRGPVAVDTGFIVYNDRTYPNLVKLFARLGVEWQPSDMSFAVANPRTGFEYSSRGWRGFYAQGTNLLRAEHHRLLREILRFNRRAPRWLEDPAAASRTIGEVVAEGRFDSVFTERYLYPMAAAVWSMPVETVRSFPALTLLRFFDNHGMLGIHTHPRWKVLRGGSQSYIAPLTAPYQDRVFRGAAVRGVTRTEEDITLHFHDRPHWSLDAVVFACHGDQVLPILNEATDAERDILASFATTRNEVCLHTDASFLPKRARARASWNYSLGGDGAAGATVTYHMNRLQSLRLPEDYCVTLNGAGIDPAKVLRRMVYRHPRYDRAAVEAQQRWKEISGRNRTHYCGAHWFYGFHEDGLNSALRVARSLGVEC